MAYAGSTAGSSGEMLPGVSVGAGGAGAPVVTATGAPVVPLIGQRLGPFRVRSLLGEGGMGKVYLAEHEVIGRRAAIKVLEAEIATNDELCSRFFNEARAVNDIRHPNIVEVTDFGRFGTQPYIVMELLEGETLEGRLLRVKTLDERATARVVAQVASAVGAAHERGLVHRDLKPANIFLRNHPDYPDFVKVLDFGIAKLVGGAVGGGKPGHHTEVGAVIGTPAYMSPEQALGEATLDHRSDVYSLGVVMYLMLTGRLPFDGDTMGRLIMAHVGEAPIPPAAVNPAISAGMNEIVLRALAKRPADRFPSMPALKDALAAAGTRIATPVVGVPVLPRTLTPAPTVTPGEARPGALEPAKGDTLRGRLVDVVRARVQAGTLVVPPLGARMLRCLDVLRSPEFSFGGVAAVVAEDPRLAAQVFQIANTVAVTVRAPARTLEQAIGRLGAEGLTTALVEIAARPVLEAKEKRTEEICRRPWQHALAVAMLAERLAEGCSPPLPGAEAFRAGLLHDVGRPLVAGLLLEIERQMAPVRGRRWLDPELLGRCIADTHGAAGAAVARAWQLSSAVVAGVEGAARPDLGAGRSLAAVVRLADALAAQEGFASHPAEEARTAGLAELRRGLGLDDRAVARAAQGVKERVVRRA